MQVSFPVFSLTTNEEQQAPESKTTTPDVDVEKDVESLSVPDGDLVAWITVAWAWLVMFSTLGYIYSFGLYEG
ncbi:hypothetical protein C8R44DRAFT_874532 [Mycena epipterygia]|nr:hypothetical protein C8R44DRAFT_874532 [Mycena epipterygia]